MGKGTPAALAAAYHQGSLRLLLADRDTAETLRALNRIVFDFAYPEAFFRYFALATAQIKASYTGQTPDIRQLY